MQSHKPYILACRDAAAWVHQMKVLESVASPKAAIIRTSDSASKQSWLSKLETQLRVCGNADLQRQGGMFRG